MKTRTVFPDFEIVDRKMAEVLRAKTGPERLRMAWGLRESAERLLPRYLSAEHPDWDERAIAQEVASRLSKSSERAVAVC